MVSLQKQEPMDQDRNDSGINSGSDFHSSSPGSDNSQDFNQIYNQNGPQTSTYYSTPVLPRNNTSYQTNASFNQQITSPINANHHQSVLNDSYDMKHETTLTEQLSPNFLKDDGTKTPENESVEDHLRRLQMSLEKTLLPSTSPKPSEQSNDDDNTDDIDDCDEHDVRMPKMNSHGKVKKFKCKQCNYIAITKLEFWEHTKGHIKAEKMLTCPKCPFVTEYKHHLEYHLRNHFGSKPFKCDKCSYSCVNKSMLNSHMKSHSNVYQYRCSDCSYATKYCHSLKLHLRKYSHKPAMVLNPDGTPNPLPIIDVYGTRRGPKQKSHHHQGKEDEQQQQALPNPLAQLMMTTPPQFPLSFPYPFLGGFPAAALNNPLFFQNLQTANQNKDENSECDDDRSLTSSTQNDDEDKSIKDETVLDLSKPDNNNDQRMKNRRKGKAIKLDKMQLDGSEEDEEESAGGSDKINDEVLDDVQNNDSKDVKEVKETTEETVDMHKNKNGDFSCPFCDINFGDIILYTMHMGYHGYKDPFTCNMCGQQCDDKVAFFLHIARTSHS